MSCSRKAEICFACISGERRRNGVAIMRLSPLLKVPGAATHVAGGQQMSRRTKFSLTISHSASSTAFPSIPGVQGARSASYAPGSGALPPNLPAKRGMCSVNLGTQDHLILGSVSLPSCGHSTQPLSASQSTSSNKLYYVPRLLSPDYPRLHVPGLQIIVPD
jgi:hypothetical protein